MKKLIINEGLGILAMSILLIPQIAHTLYVFEANSHYEHPWFSLCYAVGVDLAILIFTVKGWLRTAFAYLFATLAHNLVYQFMPEGALASILISVMQSATLFSFCHLFFKKAAPQTKGLEVSKEAMKIHDAIQAGVCFEAQPHICPECDQPFSNSKQLNGHISGHKSRKEWKSKKYGNWKQGNDYRAELLY